MAPNADHAAETTITLTDKFVASVRGAAEAGRPLVVAYVHESGGPHLSIRGTVQVLGQHRLALWSRRSSVPQSISANPRLELLYQNAQLSRRRRGRSARREGP